MTYPTGTFVKTDPWGDPIGAPAPAPQSPAYGYPQPAAFHLGDLAVTDQHILTPRGPISRYAAEWHIQEHWGVKRDTPQWAMICGLVGMIVVGPLSLLLLLVQEDVTWGAIHVTVTGDGIQHTTRLPVTSVPHAHALRHQLASVQHPPYA